MVGILMQNFNKTNNKLLLQYNIVIKTQYAQKTVLSSSLLYTTARISIGFYRSLKHLKKFFQKSSPKQDTLVKDTIILYQFPRNLNAPSISPFALKLETWLRMSNLTYINKPYGQLSSRNQIPWIKLNDLVVEDSQLCIEYLSKVFNVNLNDHLNAEQKALSRAVAKITDESLKWNLALHRFWYSTNKKETSLPFIAYWLMGFKVYLAGYFQGYGRYTIDEFYEIGKKDLKAIDTIIGKKKYLFSNEKPCDADASVFGMCSQFIYCDLGPFHHYVKTECPNIIRFVENIKIEYWKDWNIKKIKK